MGMLSRHESNESSQSSGYFSDYKVPTKKRFQCPHCGLYPSNRRSKIMKHIKKMHSPNYDHKCLHCKKTFHSKVYLKLHIKVTHPEALKIAIDEDVSESNAKVELLQVAMNLSCSDVNKIDFAMPKLKIKQEPLCAKNVKVELPQGITNTGFFSNDNIQDWNILPKMEIKEEPLCEKNVKSELPQDAAKIGIFKNNEIQENIVPKMEIKQEPIFAKDGIDDAFQGIETVKVFIRSILNNIVDSAIKHCGPTDPEVREGKRRKLVKEIL